MGIACFGRRRKEAKQLLAWLKDLPFPFLPILLEG
jgi:hypothetical protein